MTETDFAVQVSSNQSEVGVGDLQSVVITMTLPAGLTTDLVVEVRYLVILILDANT